MAEAGAAAAVVVLAIGRRDAGDDAAGPLVLDALRGLGTPALLRAVRPDPGDLHDALAGRDTAVLVDACRSGAPPGTIHVFDLAAGALPEGARARHGLGLGQALALVGLLSGLPRRCRLYGVEGTDFTPGAPPSAPVRAAIPVLAGRLHALLVPAA